MHGGSSTGAGDPARPGNQNARTHGLFAKSLDPVGLDVYDQARELPTGKLAAETAEFLIAQVAQACSADADLATAEGVVAEALRAAVKDERVSEKAAERILRRIATPDLPSLGKALGPLKGLLELRAGAGGDEEDGPPERFVVVDPGDDD